jgi:hypothetical protein
VRTKSVSLNPLPTFTDARASAGIGLFVASGSEFFFSDLRTTPN